MTNTVSLGTLLLLGACATLPASGPTANQLLNDERGEAAAIGFQVIDLSSATMPAPMPVGLRSTAGLEALAGGGRVDVLGPGDVIDIQIFEVGTSLFGGSASFGAGGGGGVGSGDAAGEVTARNRPLNGITVDRYGRIILPYIGTLNVAGKTTAEVQQLVVRGLAGKSQAPQALVTVRDAVSTTVLIGGQVAQPGRQTLRLGGARLLDAIASAGGIRAPLLPYSAVVRLNRGGRIVETYLESIVPGSEADVVLQPGDRIDVTGRSRSLTVFGAAGRVSQLEFETPQVTLGEAIARAGGPSEQLADPSAVFIFRYVPAGTVDVNGQLVPESTPERPIIYRLNLLKPSSYFLAQRFEMRDKDVIFIASARAAQTRKLVEIVNLLLSPFAQAAVQFRR